uniref:Alpha-ribazole phosphatase n=1 Tax=Candidatus Kentrum sp. MB TaxID=2138164 RepID=A0A450XLJ2_9GAMM|nr:MAG: alpha-ribazole phosphatase [Candidatus Kentron sp. MB]
MGRTDSPLTEAGVAHAHRLARRLERWFSSPTVGAISLLSSPARRAQETARLATGWIGLAMETDADLWEIDFGRWEGLSFQEIVSADLTLVTEWARGEMDFGFPEGERVGSFQARVARAGARMRRFREETLIVVTHGGVIRFLICYFLGLSPQSHLMFEVNPGSISRLRLYDGGAVLAGLNDFDF